MRIRASRRAVAIAVAGLLGLGPMLLAGEPAWALLTITITSLVALAVVVRAHNKPLMLIEADFVVVAALLWTLAQLLPVPDFLIVDSVLRGRGLAGVEGLAPLSFDPGGTKERVVVCVMVVAAYGVGRLGARLAGRRVLLYVFASSCAVMAVVAFGHELTNAQHVFGLYDPVDTNPSLMSPILNSNQLGGFLAFGTVLWLGLGLSANRRPEALGDAAMGTLCAIGALGTGSRGAVLGLALGFAFALIVLLRHGNAKGKLPSRQILAAIGVLGIVLSVFAVTGMGRMATDITDGDYSKLELIAEAAHVSLLRPIIGVGRGAFEAAFASEGTSSLRFTHPENLVVQWASEWGWAFTLLAFGVWIRFLWRATRSDRIYVSIGAVAVASFVVHDFFDFSLEMPGILVVVMMTLGVLAPLRGSLAIRPTGQLALVALLAAVGGLFGVGVPSLRPDAIAAASKAVDAEGLQALASRSIAAHPLDPSVTLVLAARMAELDDPRALRWLNRTMELAPAWSSPHEIAARLLARRRAFTQALLEARQAEARRPGSAVEISCWLVPRMSLALLVSSVVGTEDVVAAERWGNRLVDCISPDRAQAFDDALITQQPTLGALLRRARHRLADDDAVHALEDLERIPEAARTDATNLLWARAVAARDGAEAGLAFLDAHVNGSDDDAETLTIRAELSAAAGDDHSLEESLSRLRTLSAGNASEIAVAWAVAGRCYRQMGREGAALEAYQRAHNLAPGENRYAWALIRLCRSIGLPDEAARYLRNLCRRGENRACRQESHLP